MEELAAELATTLHRRRIDKVIHRCWASISSHGQRVMISVGTRTNEASPSMINALDDRRDGTERPFSARTYHAASSERIPLEIRGTTSLVISLRLPQWSAEGAVTLFSGGTIPIEGIEFTRQDELGNHRLTAFGVVKRNLSWLGLGLVAWIVPTAIGAYRLFKKRTGG